MKKSPGPDYHTLQTEDGSFTLFSKNYDEACHSLSGARAETRLHYLKACELERKLKTQDTVRVLEVGFGTGLGFLETYKLAQRLNRGRLEFVSFEIDPLLKDFFHREHGDFPELNILLGNARETVKSLKEPFDCIYQDPFSPKKNPELWTYEWFLELARLSFEKTILSTYSASTSMRKSLLKAGWKLFPGSKFGKKRTATVARRIGPSDPDILHHLERSKVQALTDKDLDK